MICVTVGKRRKFVELTSVQAVIAAGDYTELLLADASSRLCSRRMRDWETSLPQKDFMRVHRAAIVRVDAVESFEKQGDGGLIQLHGHARQIRASRRLWPSVRASFEAKGKVR